MKELIFVYQAKSGVWNGFLDSIHKITSPNTYPCHLCGITYGLTSMNKEWKRFLNEIEIPVTFYYVDNLPKELPVAKFPSAFIRVDKETKLLVSKVELEKCEHVADLIALVTHKLEVISNT